MKGIGKEKKRGREAQIERRVKKKRENKIKRN